MKAIDILSEQVTFDGAKTFYVNASDLGIDADSTEPILGKGWKSSEVFHFDHKESNCTIFKTVDEEFILIVWR